MSRVHHLAPQVAALEERVARLVAERDTAQALIREFAEATEAHDVGLDLLSAGDTGAAAQVLVTRPRLTRAVSALLAEAALPPSDKKKSAVLDRMAYLAIHGDETDVPEVDRLAAQLGDEEP